MFFHFIFISLKYFFIRCSEHEFSANNNDSSIVKNIESKNKTNLTEQQSYSKIFSEDKLIDKNNFANSNDGKIFFGIQKRRLSKRKSETCVMSDEHVKLGLKKNSNFELRNKKSKNICEILKNNKDIITTQNSSSKSEFLNMKNTSNVEILYDLVVLPDDNISNKNNTLDVLQNKCNLKVNFKNDEQDFSCDKQINPCFNAENSESEKNILTKGATFQPYNKYLNIFNDKFFSKIYKKYSFHLYYLINICCNTYLTDHNNTNKVEKFRLEKFIHFINLDNEVKLISLRRNFFTRDTFHPYYMKCFIAYVNKLYDNYKYLLDYTCDMGFFKEWKGNFIKNYNWKQKKIAKYSKIKNVFINDIKYKLIFPELNILITLMDELVQYKTKGSNSFLLIISIVCIIIEIKCDSFLSSDKFADQNYDIKIYLHYIELLKVRSFLLIFYIKYFTYKPIVIKGIIVCFMNYMVVNNWEFIKVDIKILFSKFNETVKKIIEMTTESMKTAEKHWSCFLKKKSYKDVLTIFTDEVFEMI